MQSSQGKGRLEGKVAIVTGGSRGIGLSIAQGYAREGAVLVLTSRHEKDLEAPAAGLRGQGARVLTMRADVSQQQDVKDMVNRTVETFGRIDVLVNNAGIALAKPTAEMELENWQKVLDINLTGVFICSQEAGKVMLAQDSGCIVNIASLSSFVGMPERAPYGVAKTAILGLTRVLAAEWGPKGIRVNAIAPGYILTAMTEKALAQGWLDAEGVVARTPLRRLGTPEDLAGAAIFLASEESAFITGQVLAVDGGFLAYGYRSAGPASK